MKQQLKDISIRVAKAIGIGVVGTAIAVIYVAILAFSCVFVADFFSGAAAFYAGTITLMTLLLATVAFIDRW